VGSNDVVLVTYGFSADAERAFDQFLVQYADIESALARARQQPNVIGVWEGDADANYLGADLFPRLLQRGEVIELRDSEGNRDLLEESVAIDVAQAAEDAVRREDAQAGRVHVEEVIMTLLASSSSG
jgi:hypothetical protein